MKKRQFLPNGCEQSTQESESNLIGSDKCRRFAGGIPLRSCYQATHNGMTVASEKNRETIHQEALQRVDKNIKPYDIFGNLEEIGKGRPLPRGFGELEAQIMGADFSKE